MPSSSWRRGSPAACAGVPARACQVEAADEREPVVDHDQLLVMGRAARMRAVEPEHDAAMGCQPARYTAASRAPARRSSRNPTRAHRCAGCAAGRQRVQERRERVGSVSSGPPGASRIRLSTSQPTMNTVWRARSSSAQRREYASPSTSIVKRSAARIVSQLRPRSSRPCRGSRSPAWRRRSPRRRVSCDPPRSSGTGLPVAVEVRQPRIAARMWCPPPGRMRIEPCAFAGAPPPRMTATSAMPARASSLRVRCGFARAPARRDDTQAPHACRSAGRW